MTLNLADGVTLLPGCQLTDRVLLRQSNQWDNIYISPPLPSPPSPHLPHYVCPHWLIPDLNCLTVFCWHFMTFSRRRLETFISVTNNLEREFSQYLSSWGLNLPERDSLASPGESLVSVFSVVTILHVLLLTLDFLSTVAILSLGGNKISCQTTQSNDMKYLDIYYQLILRILEGQTGQVKTDNFPLFWW